MIQLSKQKQNWVPANWAVQDHRFLRLNKTCAATKSKQSLKRRCHGAAVISVKAGLICFQQGKQTKFSFMRHLYFRLHKYLRLMGVKASQQHSNLITLIHGNRHRLLCGESLHKIWNRNDCMTEGSVSPSLIDIGLIDSDQTWSQSKSQERVSAEIWGLGSAVWVVFVGAHIYAHVIDTPAAAPLIFIKETSEDRQYPAFYLLPLRLSPCLSSLPFCPSTLLSLLPPSVQINSNVGFKKWR